MPSLREIMSVFFLDTPVSENCRLVKSEMIDYVDEDNNIIGPVTREEAHGKGLLHRVVWIMVLNDKDEILIQKRHKSKGVSPGFWDLSVGGHVDSGEGYETVSKREMKEEIGLDCELKEIKEGLFSYEYPNGLKDRELYKLYVCRSNGPFKIQEEEVEEVRFVKPEEIERMKKDGEKK